VSPASPWRSDCAFLAFAEKVWPADYKLIAQGGYGAQGAVTRMLRRWECFAALRLRNSVILDP